jgi:hypothetical protein
LPRQDRPQGGDQHDVVGQQQGFPREPGKGATGRQFGGADGEQDQGAANYHAQKAKDEHPSGRIGGEGMNR